MNVTTLRLRYTQLFILLILGSALSIMALSLSDGTSQFEDNFWNRNLLISRFAELKLALGDQVFPQALVGKNGWLEYTGDKNLDDYQNVIETDPKRWVNTQKKIQRLYQQLKKRNITLLIFIAPNKATIYPDKLPDEIKKLAPKSTLDTFTEYINAHGPPVLLDIRPALLNGRKKQDIYYATDTHWNTYGAFIAYTEIMKELAKTYPELAPKKIDTFKLKTNPSFRQGIPSMMGVTNILEPFIRLESRKNTQLKWDTLNNDRIPFQEAAGPNPNRPTLLIYMDSFGGELKNFIPLHFSKTTVIQNISKYPDLLTLKKIDEIQPNIIIIEFVERSLSNQRLYNLLQKLLSEKN